MNGFKSIFASTTFWGVAVSVLSKVLIASGYQITEGLEKEITDLVVLAVGFAGDATAIFGRVKATKKIG